MLGEPGPVLLGLGTINRNGGFRAGNLKTYGGESSPRTLLGPGDLYVSLKDVTHAADLLGAVARVPDSVQVGRLTQDTIGLDVDDAAVNRSYLYWALQTPNYRSYCKARGTGTTNLDLSRDDFLAFKISLPGRPQQRAIAEVLGALDNKIAANSRVATTAKMLQAAEFMRLMSGAGVPSTIRNVLTFEYGKPLLAQNRTTGNVDVFGSGGIVGSHNEALASGPGVVVGRKGTAGAVHWAPEDYYPIDTTFFVVSSDIEIYSMIFCYHLLKSVRLSEQNSDSAVPGLNRNDAHAIKIRLPDKESTRRFTLTAMPQANLAAQCDRESLVLAATRDALLPQLMSGKLRVKDVEKSLAGVL